MASSENSFLSERSHPYILRKQEFKTSQIMEIIYRSKIWVIKWPVCDETGEFSQRKGRARLINQCFGQRQ